MANPIITLEFVSFHPFAEYWELEAERTDTPAVSSFSYCCMIAQKSENISISSVFDKSGLKGFFLCLMDLYTQKYAA